MGNLQGHWTCRSSVFAQMCFKPCRNCLTTTAGIGGRAKPRNFVPYCRLDRGIGEVTSGRAGASHSCYEAHSCWRSAQPPSILVGEDAEFGSRKVIQSQQDCLFPPEARISDCDINHSTTMKSEVTKEGLLFQGEERRSLEMLGGRGECDLIKKECILMKNSSLPHTSMMFHFLESCSPDFVFRFELEGKQRSKILHEIWRSWTARETYS
ncbi:uncharacterized protein LOC135307813 isoform X2 [Passer domesticus]|uniref:uncharacterized protein LOC135307813 isoform X2 n=1 Tax=Passer domesticus TaxID=48849 RepID=UPI0030FF20D1